MIYKLAIIISIIFVVFILNLVRKNKLDEKYSIVWLIFALIILVFSIFPQLVTTIANFFLVFYPPSLLFLVGFITVIIYIIHLSIVVTKQNKMLVKLTQELAISREKDSAK